MKKLTLAAGLLLGLTSSTFASDGTIAITGKVTEQTCQIKTGTNNQTVSLPSVGNTSLSSKGSTAGRTAFTIFTTGCKNNGSSFGIYFLPDVTKVNTETGNLRNISTSQTKSNTEIQLLNDDLTPIVIGKDIEKQNVKYKYATNVAEQAQITYYAQYYALGATTAGDVKAQVEYNIVYK